MQTLTDPTRIVGRNSVVHTRDGAISGTIVAAGNTGVTLSVDRRLVSLSAGSVLRITTA